ncbi:TPA: phage GP46 family protein [Escherichia coli]
MTISFNTIPSNTLVPLFYAEMDNQAANTAQDSGASLLIGHANNGAEIVANSLVLMPSADYARQICGAGSQLARMVEAYRQTDPFGELYVIAVPEATGAAATVTLTVTGAATETGTVNVYVGRTRVQAPVTNGDNVTTIASSIQDAINAVPALPFTASSSAGVVTLTARHKGLCGNEIPVSLNYYGFGGGEVLPAGVQIAVATGTAGTGAPVLTGAVAAMADEPFDYIGLPFNDTASVNTLVRGYIRECLQWMIDDGVVSRIDLDIRRTGINELGNSITLWHRDGPVMISFDDLWSAITHGGQ